MGVITHRILVKCDYCGIEGEWDKSAAGIDRKGWIGTRVDLMCPSCQVEAEAKIETALPLGDLVGTPFEPFALEIRRALKASVDQNLRTLLGRIIESS